MMIKKSKEEVLREINAAASGACYGSLQNTFGPGLRIDTNSITYGIQLAIAQAVEAGFRKLMDNIYSDAEFEEDMTLR